MLITGAATRDPRAFTQTLLDDLVKKGGALRRAEGANLLTRFTRQLADGSRLRIQAYYDHTDREHPGTFGETLDIFDLEAQHGEEVGEFFGRQVAIDEFLDPGAQYADGFAAEWRATFLASLAKATDVRAGTEGAGVVYSSDDGASWVLLDARSPRRRSRDRNAQGRRKRRRERRRAGQIGVSDDV